MTIRLPIISIWKNESVTHLKITQLSQGEELGTFHEEHKAGSNTAGLGTTL